MKDGIKELTQYFEQYLEREKDESIIKQIKKILSLIEERKYITDYDLIVELVKKYEDKDLNSKLVDIMLYLNIYNIYLMNKKIMNTTPILDKDIEYNVEIDLTDILSYLNIKEEEIDPNLISDLKKFGNKEDLMEMATFLKNGYGKERILFDKITDKNVLLLILLHSNKDNINQIIKIFEENDVSLNKFIPNMPFIFIERLISDKCKYSIPTNYNKFMENYKIIKKHNLDFKLMSSTIVFFINEPSENENNIRILESKNLKPQNVLYFCGNILTINPQIVFNNIEIAKFHNIEFTDDDNNNGYTILGMENLDEKMSYLIEQGYWKQNESKLDNLDLIRALIIKDDYLSWKNNKKYDIVESNLFSNEVLTDDAISKIYKQYHILGDLDDKYLINDNYLIGTHWISKYRLLKNLNNFKGKENALVNSLHYNSSLSNEALNEITDVISSLGMGDENVKLSKGI